MGILKIFKRKPTKAPPEFFFPLAVVKKEHQISYLFFKKYKCDNCYATKLKKRYRYCPDCGTLLFWEV